MGFVVYLDGYETASETASDGAPLTGVRLDVAKALAEVMRLSMPDAAALTVGQFPKELFECSTRLAAEGVVQRVGRAGGYLRVVEEPPDRNVWDWIMRGE